jgi:hydrogenase nickel incorporation protein HypB
MCKDCGCQEGNKRAYFGAVIPTARPTKKISLVSNVLAKNDSFAESNRTWFKNHNIKTINIMSSPGAGKTLLLEKTLSFFPAQKNLTIITGDQEESFDADRLIGKGATVKQLNTFSSCHLDAQMISKELGESVKIDTDLLIIENVGNLVCPAAFDLGENIKVALLSTTEGEDKPSKYPVLFHTASVIIITKIDLIPHLDWNLDKCISHVRKVNATSPILLLSAKTGEGMPEWMSTLNNILG